VPGTTTRRFNSFALCHCIHPTRFGGNRAGYGREEVDPVARLAKLTAVSRRKVRWRLQVRERRDEVRAETPGSCRSAWTDSEEWVVSPSQGSLTYWCAVSAPQMTHVSGLKKLRRVPVSPVISSLARSESYLFAVEG